MTSTKHVRIDEKLYERIVKKAKKEKRKIQTVIEMLIIKGLKK